jgi:V/A-type H+/Na+-transporting ATPase subunit C
LPDDFGYLNARIRHRRRQLLQEGFFREALNLSFSEIVKVLGETPYGADLTGEALSDVDRAVQVHLARTVADLPRLVSGRTRETVRLLLIGTDLVNVKTIIRAKREGRAAEEILGMLRGGTLPPGLYGPMIEAPDVAALAQVLALSGHPLVRALREAARAGGQPPEEETILDRAFYKALLRRSRELDQPYLARFVGFEIDALNLATAFKLPALGLQGSPERYFLPGGRQVGLPLFQRVAAGETAAMEELGNTDFARVAEVRDLAALERGLRCVLLEKAREGAKDALGAGLVIDYIERKEWEAGRIRLLARRAYYNLPSALVEPEVFCQ